MRGFLVASNKTILESNTKLKRINLRPIQDNDWEFVYSVYASTREEELKPVPWSAEEKENFLRFQFHAQRTYYDEHFKDAEFSIIEVDGEAAGRLYLDRREDEIRLVDIALLPTCRGQGVGSQLMADILAEGERKKLLVRIHVESNNPAMRLYHHLGFEKIEEQGVYWLMEWIPESLKTTAG